MKVLLAHNYYGSSAPSGENQAFEAELRLLQQRGHAVTSLVRHSDDIRAKGAWGAIIGALSTPWNFSSASTTRSKVVAEKPDIVHVHNTFPLLSPAVFHAVGNRAARVLTLHNYRLFCPAAIPFRNGKVCTACLDSRSSWPSLKYGCYRDSRLATAPLALSVNLHRRLGTWTRAVDAFIALTAFQRDRMVEAGLPPERVFVKPNFYAGNPAPVEWQERRDYAVFAGRLSTEKGIETLIRAWLAMAEGPELHVLGDGPLWDVTLRLLRSRPNAPIRLLGRVSSDEAEREIAQAKLLLVPSQCFEGFPMVIREAFAFGTPVAVSNLGPLPAIVQHGLSGIVFEAGNADSLQQAVQEAFKTPGLLERLSIGARLAFEQSYTEEVNYRALMNIYERAIATHQARAAIK